MTHAPETATEGLRPVEDFERLILLDVLRGFALYGVLLANTIPWYSGNGFLSQAERAARTSSLDIAALDLVNIFIDNKAMTLFSFLFGLGFAVQLQRASAQGRNIASLYPRRLGILFAIGAFHISVIYWGDILTSYAIIGLALLLFHRCTDRTRLRWAAGFAVIPPILFALPPVADIVARIVSKNLSSDAYKAQVYAALSGHDYPLLIKTQIRQYLLFLTRVGLPTIPWVLCRFLIGYVVGRQGLLDKLPNYLPTVRKLFVLGLGLGLTCTLGVYVGHLLLPRDLSWPMMATMGLLRELGTLALASAYLTAIALLMQNPRWQRCLTILAPAGQTALSSYLLQSVLCTFVFYGWGLGLLGHIGPALCIPLTLGIFGIEILLARVWLKSFRFGPAEWIWRSLTYGKWQPMRRSS